MPSVLAAAALSGGPHLAEHSSPFFIYISSPVLCGWLLLCERGSWYFEFSSNYFWRDVHYGSSAATGQSHTVSDLCRGAHPLALALPLVAPPCGSHSGWRRVMGRAFYDFCLVGDFYTTQNVTANKSSWSKIQGQLMSGKKAHRLFSCLCGEALASGRQRRPRPVTLL